jgi:hypothetical protein
MSETKVYVIRGGDKQGIYHDYFKALSAGYREKHEYGNACKIEGDNEEEVKSKAISFLEAAPKDELEAWIRKLPTPFLWGHLFGYYLFSYLFNFLKWLTRDATFSIVVSFIVVHFHRPNYALVVRNHYHTFLVFRQTYQHFQHLF